jgi:hypothetical protein
MLVVGISWPNARECGDAHNKYGNTGAYKQGDRAGVLPDLENGSLRFFKNGVQRAAWAWLPSGQCDGANGGSSADGAKRAAAAECRNTSQRLIEKVQRALRVSERS